jgi:hypothetical protein
MSAAAQLTPSSTPDYAALISKEREALLKNLEKLRAYAQKVSVSSGIPYEIQAKVSDHLNTLRDLQKMAVKTTVLPAVRKVQMKKPKILTQFIDKVNAFDAFMESDKKTLYVFLTANDDKESRQALGEVTCPDCRGFSWSCTIHSDGNTFFNGTPDKPTKHVYYLKAGEEALATEQNAERLYMGPDSFCDTYERNDAVQTTPQEKKQLLKDFFALGEQLLVIVNVGSSSLGPVDHILKVFNALTEKRPAVTLNCINGEQPIHLPAVGYAQGQEVPPEVVIYSIDEASENLIPDIEEKYSYTRTYARQVRFAYGAEA